FHLSFAARHLVRAIDRRPVRFGGPSRFDLAVLGVGIYGARGSRYPRVGCGYRFGLLSRRRSIADSGADRGIPGEDLRRSQAPPALGCKPLTGFFPAAFAGRIAADAEP